MDPYWWWWPSIILAVALCLWLTAKAGIFDGDDDQEADDDA